MINGDDSKESNVTNLSDTFTGLRMDISGGELLIERRTSSSWSSAQDLGVDLLDFDSKYEIEFYANNSINDLNYYRNGESFPVDSGFWSLWINGNKVTVGFGTNDGNAPGASLGLEENLSSIRFLAGRTSGEFTQIEIDDIVYSNTLPDVRTVDGDAGWRMLAAPHDGFEVEQLGRQNLVQGVTDSEYPSDAPNVYVGYDGTSFVEATNTSTTLNRGEGFIWYLYDNALVPESKPLPLDLTAANNQTTGDVTVNLHSDGDNFNLLGNPFSTGLDISDIGSWATGGTLASATVQIWDPSAGASGSYTAPTSNIVSSFQGFFIENDNATQLVIPESAQATDQEFFKDNTNKRMIAFELLNEEDGFVDKSIRLVFREDADHDWDLYDGTKLYPLSGNFIGMGFKGNRDGETVLKSQESRPFDLNQDVSIPMEFFSSNAEGNMTFSISSMDNIPDGWTIEIEDRETGERREIDAENSFSFYAESQASPAKIQSNGSSLSAPKVTTESDEGSSRFVMHISPSDSEIGDGQLPESIALNQNYPNPFNPTTTISYELPQTSNVLLEVYDMLGRQVATLVNDQLSAGAYEVDFNGANLSSGIYIYRLTAGNTIINKKLTILK